MLKYVLYYPLGLSLICIFIPHTLKTHMTKTRESLYLEPWTLGNEMCPGTDSRREIHSGHSLQHLGAACAFSQASVQINDSSKSTSAVVGDTAVGKYAAEDTFYNT